MKNCSESIGATDYSALNWRVPLYIFSGVGGMLLIIAFTSLILAYSFWKLSRPNGNELIAYIEHSTQLPSVNNGCNIDYKEEAEKVVVMMPGDEQPTFVAKPTAVTEGIICKL
jgi:hypothetical protein